MNIPVNHAIKGTDITGPYLGAYHASSFSEHCRDGIDNIYRRVQPNCQAIIGVIASLRSIELFGLLLKHKEDAVGRVAGLELGGEWVRKKVLLCATFICFQGLVENLLEVGGRRGSIVSMKVIRHTA